MDANQQKRIEDALALVSLSADGMASQIAAAFIVDALLPEPANAGGMYYRLKAQAWLTLLLAAEPGLSLAQFAERVRALSAVSGRIAGELGGIAGRLAPQAA